MVGWFPLKYNTCFLGVRFSLSLHRVCVALYLILGSALIFYTRHQFYDFIQENQYYVQNSKPTLNLDVTPVQPKQSLMSYYNLELVQHPCCVHKLRVS